MKKIPEIAFRMLASSYRIEQKKLKYLAGGHEWSDGVLFEYVENSAEKVLKFMSLPVNSAEDIAKVKERLNYLHFLGKNDVSIVYPSYSKNNSIFEQYTDGDTIYICYSMNKLIGGNINSISESELSGFYEEWGRVLGRLHSASRAYIPTVDPIGFCWKQEWEHFNSSCQDKDVRAIWNEIRLQLEKLPMDSSCYGFIHNDPHPYNMFVQNNKITLIDFDVACYHWFMTDISIAVYSALGQAAGKFEKPQKDRSMAESFMADFFRGYNKENQIEKEWMSKLELFLSYRRILLFIAMYDGIKKDKKHFDIWRSRILDGATILDY